MSYRAMAGMMPAWIGSVVFASISFVSLASGDEIAAKPAETSFTGIDGTLVICGGGTLPDEIVNRFLEAAGGAAAKLVLVPTASKLADRVDADWFLSAWKERGLKTVSLLHTRSKEEADREEFVAPLREANAVWLYGGNQSQLAAAYVGTRFERELHALLKRGGVIGGTSAGAAIMSRMMIARGYQQPELGVGFDLLPDAVIDQHFLRRQRLPRLQAVLQKNPNRFGVGIDEGTALLVKGSRLQVIGESVVTVCLAPSAKRPASEITLRPGAEANLAELRRAAREATSAVVPNRNAAVVKTASRSETSAAR